MSKSEIQIDESTHERVPSTGERISYALLSLVLGFFLINIVTFWMFPGIGIGGFYLFSPAHPSVSVTGELTIVFIYTFLAICIVFGWFRGKRFSDRLLTYIDYWKFW